MNPVLLIVVLLAMTSLTWAKSSHDFFDPAAAILTPHGTNPRIFLRLKEVPTDPVSFQVLRVPDGHLIRSGLEKVSDKCYDWDATDDSGRLVKSGLYIVRCAVAGHQAFGNTVYVAY